MTANLLTLRP